ncbi:hypothetical protein [Micromonospora sp. DPT]|uniref:hypothetical protein n=1 Tax=Micromonospora sp. DPT TaxID=3142975 RepID=UPI00320B7B68
MVGNAHAAIPGRYQLRLPGSPCGWRSRNPANDASPATSPQTPRRASCCSPRSIGELRSVKDGKYRRILPEWIDEYIQAQIERQDAA